MRNAEDDLTLRLLHAHSPVRHFQNGADIPAGDERVIVEAAQRASTSCNLQTYSLLNKDVRPFLRQLLEGLGFGFK